MAEKRRSLVERLRHLPMRVQITLAMVFVGGLTLLLVTGQSLHCVHEGLTGLQQEHFARFQQEQQRRVADWVREKEELVRVMTANPVLRQSLHTGALSAAWVQFAEAGIRENRDLVQLDVLSAEGERLPFGTGAGSAARAESAESAEGAAGAGAGAEGAALKGDEGIFRNMLIWENAFHEHGNRRDEVTATVTLLRDDQMVLGYVMATFSLRALQESLQGSGEESFRSYLVDAATGTYVTPPDWVEGEEKVAFLSGEQLHHGAQGLRHYLGTHGTHVIGLATTVEPFDWLLVAEMDEKRAYGMVFFLIRRALISGAVVGVLILVIGFFAARCCWFAASCE